MNLNMNDRCRSGTLVNAAWRALDRAGAMLRALPSFLRVGTPASPDARVHLRPGGDRPSPETVVNWDPSSRRTQHEEMSN